jgi:S-adenosylmethionine:tRNA-ribosyltransferase-isomerase (queuine synthetase)
MSTFAFDIQRVEASGTIYIRADGSIDPPTANITSTDNIIYMFSDSNYDEIIVREAISSWTETDLPFKVQEADEDLT